MCTVLLSPGVNPIAVDKYININIIINYKIQGNLKMAVGKGKLIFITKNNVGSSDQLK
jgi:hypothetical protein